MSSLLIRALAIKASNRLRAWYDVKPKRYNKWELEQAYKEFKETGRMYYVR